MLTFFEATPAQVSFIKDLIEAKNVGETGRAKIVLRQIEEGKLDKKEASKIIDELKVLPVQKTFTPKGAAATTMQELLALVPKSKYAISMDELDLALEETVNGDTIFVEIKEYMNSLYIRRLHGSVGGFTRTKLSFNDARAIVAVLKKEPVKYVQLFGELHKCCGKCGADLTDEISRALKIGPKCRQTFGI